jgi:hypothetical protein
LDISLSAIIYFTETKIAYRKIKAGEVKRTGITQPVLNTTFILPIVPEIDL